MAFDILILIGILIYFIPSFLGWKTKNASGIIVLNLFLGWTLLGWVGALIWAVTAKKEEKPGGKSPGLVDSLITFKKTIFMQTDEPAEEEEINRFQDMLKEGEAIIKNVNTGSYKIVTAEEWDGIVIENQQNEFEIIEEK